MCDLSIVIVNWNSKEFLRGCLDSLGRNTSTLRTETIVVDNASFDGSAGMVAAEFPDVQFIQAEENLGFARANNLGASRAIGRALLFLNPDTEVLGDALAELTAVLSRRPDAGIVGPTLLNSDGTIQRESIRTFPTLLNQVLDSSYLKARFPRSPLWGMKPLFDRPSAPVPVDGVSGACLMVKRDVFVAVGGFSLLYFMYSEDVDLCYRVRTKGWGTYYQPAACVVHHGGRSSTLTPVSHFAAVLIRESRFRFFGASRGRVYAALFRVTTGANAVGRLALLLAIGPALSVVRPGAAGAALGKWIRVLRWSVGLERWARSPGERAGARVARLQESALAVRK